MDEMKLPKALGMLQAIVDELPDGSVDIKETYVNLYHRTLSDIQSELHCDLSEYFIPASELKRHVTSIPSGIRLPSQIRSQRSSQVEYSQESYCERARFMIALKGAVNFINSLLTQEPAKRIVGFGK